MSTETIQAGTQFNQELITKARKGEIAILNDGGADVLNKIMNEVKPGTFTHNGFFKYYKFTHEGWYITDDGIFLRCPIQLIKDFFMPDTKEPEIVWNSESFVKDDRPRTYKVTRQQMKEIWEAAPNEKMRNDIRKDAEKMFTNVFAEQTEITHGDVASLLRCLNIPYPDAIKSIWPEYFFIPEGEPVLVRRNDCEVWRIYISDGAGGVYIDSYIKAGSCTWKFIIPFTKNPPK